MNKKIKIRRCDKVEIFGTKDGQRKIIATVVMKGTKVVVQSEDKSLKKNLEEFLNEGYRFLRWTRVDSFGFRQEKLTSQKPGDPFFLETLVGPWTEYQKEWRGYINISARRAGKIWEEEVPEKMLGVE